MAENADPNRLLTDQDLNRLQLSTLQYYLHETNPATSLTRDKTDRAAPSSIAAVGLALASLPILVERGVIAREFAPEIVIPTINYMAHLNIGVNSRYGFKPSFNRTYEVPDSPTGWWVSPYHFGIDQGPIILMVENHRTGLIWDIMRRSPYVVSGLRRAGFTGGWLEH